MASVIDSDKPSPEKGSGFFEFISHFKVEIMFAFLLGVSVLLIWILAKKSKAITNAIEQNKLAQTKIIIYAGLAIIFLLFISGVVVHNINGSERFLINLSITIIISWFVLLICYYAWALFFYNVGLGWSDDKWNRFRVQSEDPTTVQQARNKNPHDEETLGLPPGTVRGTIALTLLVGALALTIASFGMDSYSKGNTVLIDNFDFYKQAFLMMIAFYFGAKSLEILQNRSETPKNQNNNEDKSAKKTDKQIDPKDFQKDFNHPNAVG
jgi:hypothetical protein